eukprot:gene7729-7928_t
MLYLHSHKPVILHRDLKSPNLFVTTALHVKVGDFNLSRYMNLGDSCVKSSLTINPRWQAPEVIADGSYSTSADVYAFGVVLWELLTWQEPWEEEGWSSFQIMMQGLLLAPPPGVDPHQKQKQEEEDRSAGGPVILGVPMLMPLRSMQQQLEALPLPVPSRRQLMPARLLMPASEHPGR